MVPLLNRSRRRTALLQGAIAVITRRAEDGVYAFMHGYGTGVSTGVSSETEADFAALVAASHAEADIAANANAIVLPARGPQDELPGADERVGVVRIADLAGPGAGHWPDCGDQPALGIGGRFQVTGPLEYKASQRIVVALRPRVGVERVGQHLDLRAVFQVGGAEDDAAPLHMLARGQLQTGGDLSWCQRVVDPLGIEGGSAGAGAQQQRHQQDAEAGCCNAVTHTHSLDDRAPAGVSQVRGQFIDYLCSVENWN